MSSSEDKRYQHDLAQCVWLMQSLTAIRSDTHYGSIELEVKDDVVTFRRKTMREHPEKT